LFTSILVAQAPLFKKTMLSSILFIIIYPTFDANNIFKLKKITWKHYTLVWHSSSSSRPQLSSCLSSSSTGLSLHQ
jgi:hypothetical protein